MPPWAVVTSERAAHVARVVALLDSWAATAGIHAADHARWLRAGWLHDALRDADEAALRALLPESADPLPLLHGPAAAARAEAEGETDVGVLTAVRWHTVGFAEWDATGRALYAADFLEPGRPFAREARAALAAAYPHDPAGVLREVVTMRAAHQHGKGRREHPMSLAFRTAVLA
jgi:2-amino-4-hydroxy-6-hydroxymethyldihydropteridine diphosphokinase